MSGGVTATSSSVAVADWVRSADGRLARRLARGLGGTWPVSVGLGPGPGPRRGPLAWNGAAAGAGLVVVPRLPGTPFDDVGARGDDRRHRPLHDTEDGHGREPAVPQRLAGTVVHRHRRPGHGQVRHGQARHGDVRNGDARHGDVGHGQARERHVPHPHVRHRRVRNRHLECGGRALSRRRGCRPPGCPGRSLPRRRPLRTRGGLPWSRLGCRAPGRTGGLAGRSGGAARRGLRGRGRAPGRTRGLAPGRSRGLALGRSRGLALGRTRGRTPARTLCRLCHHRSPFAVRVSDGRPDPCRAEGHQGAG